MRPNPAFNVARAARLAMLALALSACTQEPATLREGGDNFRVYILAGQSNMAGFGYNSDLPPQLKGPSPAYIFQGNPVRNAEPRAGHGFWAQLRPGHGAYFRSSERRLRLSPRFGPEMSFTKAMDAHYTDEKIAIIKYAQGASSLAQGIGPGGWWLPLDGDDEETTQFDHLKITIDSALAARDLNDDGAADTLTPAGVVWLQGESDAFNNIEAAQDYGSNLTLLLTALRGALGNETLPVVIVQISDSGMAPGGKVMGYADIVRRAQEEVALADPHAVLITTDDYSFLDDAWHFDSAANLDLGEKIAEAFIAMEAAAP